MAYQSAVNVLLRAVGQFAPTTAGLDFRITGRLHRVVPRHCMKPWQSGNGFLMGPATSNAGYISGTNERRFLDTVARYITRSGLIVNVGANIGYSSLYLAKATERAGIDCRFLALEPVPGTFAMLEENIALNPFAIEAVCAAAGDRDTTSLIFSTGDGDGSATLDQAASTWRSGTEISVRRLDGILAARPADENVVGIFIDVEGFGGAVLRGAVETLARSRPFIACEIHNRNEQREIAEQLEPLGYGLSSVSSSLWGTHQIWTTTRLPL